MQEPGELRAAALEQAGEAWLLDDRPDKARGASMPRSPTIPDNPDLLIDRAQAYALGGHYWEAIDDLNRALEIDPNNITALVYRASAYRNAGERTGWSWDWPTSTRRSGSTRAIHPGCWSAATFCASRATPRALAPIGRR